MQSYHDVTVEVGGIAIALHTRSAALVGLLEHRFRRFLNPSATPDCEFDITVVADSEPDEESDLTVEQRDGCWILGVLPTCSYTNPSAGRSSFHRYRMRAFFSRPGLPERRTRSPALNVWAVMPMSSSSKRLSISARHA